MLISIRESYGKRIYEGINSERVEYKRCNRAYLYSILSGFEKIYNNKKRVS